MKPQGATNAFLRDVLQQGGGAFVASMTEATQKTVESMFSQRLHTAEARAGADVQPRYAAVVLLVQEPGRFRLRLASDASLLKTLVANVYPLDALNSDEILNDVVAEIANVVAGSIKTFLNEKGLALTRDVPVVEKPAAALATADAAISLNFSIFRNNLAAGNLLNVALI